eukprot:1648403-Pyramimonas_sp.AAC.1
MPLPQRDEPAQQLANVENASDDTSHYGDYVIATRTRTRTANEQTKQTGLRIGGEAGLCHKELARSRRKLRCVRSMYPLSGGGDEGSTST